MSDTATDVPIKFTTQAVDAMNQAYEEVCNILQAMDGDHIARVKAGEVIMHLGRHGETDKRRLRDQALGAAGYHWR